MLGNKISVEVEAANLVRQLGELDLLRPEASAAAAGVYGSFFVDLMVFDLAPRDTRRYVNGWIDAGRKAGVTRHALEPLLPAGRRDHFIAQIRRELAHFVGQAEKLEKKIQWYRRLDAAATRKNNGKRRKRRTSQPYFRKLVRAQKKALKNAERVERELGRISGDESAIVFDRYSYLNRNRKITTVRAGAKGGEGRVFIARGRVFVELVNKEPHARIVERVPYFGRPVGTAMAVVRRAGARRATDKYLERAGKQVTLVTRRAVAG